jgi:BolA protein
MTNSPGPVSQLIKSKLSILNPIHLEIIDDSSKHASHKAMIGKEAVETHFRVTIVSDEFEGMKLLQRHRKVYDLLGNEMKAGLHALSINAKTCKEFKQ